MNTFLLKRLRICLLILPLVWALQPSAQADPIPVRALGGTIHGFLEMRSEDGQVIASGDTYATVRGIRITSRTISISKMARLTTRRRSFRNVEPFN